MHVPAIFAHPRRDSFTGAVLHNLLAGLAEGGHEMEIADLYREGIETRLQAEDYAQFKGEAMLADVRGEQRRIDRAEALAFVFSIWWWSFPAILKGWIDRVFSEGWVFSFTPGLSRGRLGDRPTLLLDTAGSPESICRKYGYEDAMRTQIDTGILGYCGLRDVEWRILYDVEQNAEVRERYLAEACEIGRWFLSEDRRSRVPEIGSARAA